MTLNFQRHYSLIVLLALLALGLFLGLGEQRIVAYPVAGGAQMLGQPLYLAQAEFAGLLHSLVLP